MAGARPSPRVHRPASVGSSLLSHLDDVVLDDVRHGPGGVRLAARVRAGSAECTGAGRTPAGCTVATTVTSPMHRSAAHLVEVVLRVRRFFCDNTGCPAESFAEPVPGLMTSGARRDWAVEGDLGGDRVGSGRTRRRPARRHGCRRGNRRVAAGSLGERRSSLPPGQGVSACPPAAAGSNRSLVRGVRGPVCARGRELQRLPLPGGEPLAGPRIVAELRAQLAVNVGMVGRVASGGGDAFECGDPDALIHRGGHDDHGWFTLFGTAAPGPV